MKKILVAISMVCLLAACTSDPPIQDGSTIEDRKPSGRSDTPGGIDNNSMKGDRLNDKNHPDYRALQERSIFFDYDSDAIKSEYVGVIEAHARYLRDYPNRRLLVQGNADDRGSREYNLALGQRRADAIKNRLTLLGVKAAQVESVSLGEEKPRCTDPSENCYGQNRRGDLAY